MQKHPSFHVSRVLQCALILLLASCSISQSEPTATPSAVPPALTIAPPTETVTPLPPPTVTPIPAPPRAIYTIETSIDYDAHIVVASETIVYPNHTGQQLDALVLAAIPNLWNGCFTLSSISVDGALNVNYALNGQRLDVALLEPLMPENTVTISLQYSLSLPYAEQEDPSISRPRIFGYTKRQMNLTNWYPFVVPFINGQFVLHDPWVFGEHLVYDAADYEVNVRFTNSANAPMVASSGAPEPQADYTRYTLTAGRTFALSASREFIAARQQVGGVIVSSYYFPFNESPGQAALRATSAALQIYNERYGPYPHKTLDVVMATFNDGMEYSAFYYLPQSAYNLFDGTSNNLLTTVAVHETAHQWWFEQVANDQAMQPWLDEALCAYSEIVYYETASPQSLSWWWSYWPGRLQGNYPAQGWVDTSIYDGGSFPTYTAAVYQNGAHFLKDLRERIGDEAFFAFLQDYLAQENGKIATANDFFRILDNHATADYSDLVRKYFQSIYK